MKTKIAAFFLLFFVQYLGAENYLTDSTVWTEYGINIYSTPSVAYKSQFILMGDTTISDKKYKKLYYDLSYYGAVRESDRKVYVNLIYNNPTGLEEVLLYDYTAEEGDTIRSNAVEGPISEGLVVYKIDTVTLENGQKRKRMSLTGSSDAFWIEGVGSDYGFLDPVFWKVGNFTVSKLVCFKQKGTILYSNTEFCFGDCCTFEDPWVQIKTVNVSKVDVVLNAKEEKLEIALSNNGEFIESVRLIDVSGVVIQNYKINSSGKISLSISALKSGIYFVCISSENGRYTKKISL